MTVSYSIVGDQNGQTLTVIFSDGEVHTVPTAHANFKKIREYLVTTDLDEIDEIKVKENLDLILKAGTQLTALSERVTLVGNRLLFDGDEVDESISGHILRLIEEGDEEGWKALVNFLEKVGTNPSADSRASLYSWLVGRDFTITPEGDFIAYKGVALDEEGNSVSINHGEAFVNGVVHRGAIPNPDGGVISMPRSGVNADTRVGCSTGLHAGTWNYAYSFARGRVLTVKINPRDVVSVPNDCHFQKLRVSRYEVITTTEVEYSEPTWTADYVDHGDDDFEETDDPESWDHSDDLEDDAWAEAWSHDEDGRIREIYDVTYGEEPDDIIDMLVAEVGLSEKLASDMVYGRVEIDKYGDAVEAPEESEDEDEEDVVEDVPVPATVSWFTRYSEGKPTP